MIYKKIYDFTISNSDIVIVNSNNIKRKLLELTGITPSKLTVISPGIDYKKFYRMDIGKITEHKKTYGIHDDIKLSFYLQAMRSSVRVLTFW